MYLLQNMLLLHLLAFMLGLFSQNYVFPIEYIIACKTILILSNSVTNSRYDDIINFGLGGRSKY